MTLRASRRKVDTVATVDRLPPDYHTHTELCKHAQGRPVDYLLAADETGLPGLACTDHCPTPDAYDLEHRMKLEEFERYSEWVREARAVNSLPVLFGIEADYYVGCTEFLSGFLARHSFDYILGSVHYLDYWAFANPAQRTLWETEDTQAVWKKYFELVGEMAQTRLYHVAAHLDLPKKFGHRPRDRHLREMVLPVLDVILATGMAIEINTSGLTKPVRETFPSAEILSWACEREIPITFGSDAHEPGRVGAFFDQAVALAREVGYRHSLRFENQRRTPAPLPEQIRPRWAQA